MIAVALFAARAQAADLDVIAAPPLVKAPPAAAANWSGPYVGAALNVLYNAVDANVTSATVDGVPIPLPPVSAGESNPLFFWGSGKGAMAYLDNVAVGLRVYGGWNFQVAPAYVVGFEADFDIANEKTYIHGSPFPANLIFGTPSLPFGASFTDGFGVRVAYDGSARIRGGWLWDPSTLFYLTAGVAWTYIEAESICSTVTTPNVSNCARGNYFGGFLEPAVITNSTTKLGWTAGVGAETLLWSRWIARIQYRFSDYGYPSSVFGPATFTATRTCTGCPAGANPLVVTYELPLMQHNFELGVAYKF